MSERRRFVILTHDHPVLHWDLMFDTGDALRTWRLETEPTVGVEIRAIALPDHRRMYLHYEGPVSGDRGKVSRWDSGTYSVLEETPSGLTFEVDGERVSGVIEMVREDVGDEWVFIVQDSSTNERRES